jgi:hypothetical protein
VINLYPVLRGMAAPDASIYRRRAASRCGNRIAAASWAIIYDFPQTVVASQSIREGFIVLTASGWKAY